MNVANISASQLTETDNIFCIEASDLGPMNRMPISIKTETHFFTQGFIHRDHEGDIEYFMYLCIAGSPRKNLQVFND